MDNVCVCVCIYIYMLKQMICIGTTLFYLSGNYVYHQRIDNSSWFFYEWIIFYALSSNKLSWIACDGVGTGLTQVAYEITTSRPGLDSRQRKTACKQILEQTHLSVRCASGPVFFGVIWTGREPDLLPSSSTEVTKPWKWPFTLLHEPNGA